MDSARVKVDIKRINHFLAAEIINPEVIKFYIDQGGPGVLSFDLYPMLAYKLWGLPPNFSGD